MDASSDGDDLSRAGSILLGVLAVELGVLVVTGVALFFLYRPTESQAWSELLAEGYSWDVRVAQWLRSVHRLASQLAVLTAVATGAVLAVGAWRTASRWRGVAIGVAMGVASFAASFTGYLLPWDQLALWAVEVGSNLRGYPPLFDSTVRFVLSGGVELRPSTVLWWLFVHALVVTPALLGLVVLAWRRHRHLAPVSPGPG